MLAAQECCISHQSLQAKAVAPTCPLWCQPQKMSHRRHCGPAAHWTIITAPSLTKMIRSLRLHNLGRFHDFASKYTREMWIQLVLCTHNFMQYEINTSNWTLWLPAYKKAYTWPDSTFSLAQLATTPDLGRALQVHAADLTATECAQAFPVDPGMSFTDSMQLDSTSSFEQAEPLPVDPALVSPLHQVCSC